MLKRIYCQTHQNWTNMNTTYFLSVLVPPNRHNKDSRQFYVLKFEDKHHVYFLILCLQLLLANHNLCIHIYE